MNKTNYYAFLMRIININKLSFKIKEATNISRSPFKILMTIVYIQTGFLFIVDLEFGG